MNIQNAIVNDVLCYISTARHSIPADDIVSIVHSYYEHSKIASAKTLLCEICKTHPIKRRTEDKIKVDIRDMLDFFDKIDRDRVKIPQFLVDSYDALPPATGFSVASRNISVLLDQMEQLNRGMADFWEAKEAMMSSMSDQADIKAELSDIKIKLNKMEGSMNVPVQQYSLPLDSLLEIQNPPSQTFADVVKSRKTSTTLGYQDLIPKRTVEGKNVWSNRDRNRELMNDASNIGRGPSRLETNTRRRNGMFGTRSSSGTNGLRGVVRPMDLFIGRCEPSMKTENVINHCKDVCNINVLNCEELKTKSLRFKSFKISVSFDERNILLDPKLWDEGIIIRKFYTPRVNHLNKSDRASVNLNSSVNSQGR